LTNSVYFAIIEDVAMRKNKNIFSQIISGITITHVILAQVLLAGVFVVSAPQALAANPTKPDTITTEPLSISSVKFGWKDKSTDEDDFHIERKVSGGSFSEIAVVVSTTAVTTGTLYDYTDNAGLSCDTTYSYRIRAHRHIDNTYSAWGPDNNGKNQKTLYISTNDVSDLTPDFTTPASTNVPILTFTLTSCKSNAEIDRILVQYAGDNKNDIVNMKLYQESGSVPGIFDSSSDTLHTTESTPGGVTYEFELNPPFYL
jgi:hypothetical protein